MTKKNNKPKAKLPQKAFCINKHNSSLYAYKDHAYYVFKPKQKGLTKNIVNTIIADYEVMLSHYARVFVIRIDLHPNKYSANNREIRVFLKQLSTFLSSEYQSKVIYHCAREQETSELEHYHLEIMLSAHEINHSDRILSLIRAMWEMHSNGTVAYVDNPFCIVYRGNKASLKYAIYRSSYLAKEHTKELNGKVRGFISNKLEPVKNFDLTTDLMLVDPELTFKKNNQRQLFEYAQNASTQPKKPKLKSSKYNWFNTPTHAQQLRECIASRTTSLNHLTNNTPIDDKQKYRYKDALINEQANEVITIHTELITRAAAHEPKNDHSFFDH